MLIKSKGEYKRKNSAGVVKTVHTVNEKNNENCRCTEL